MVMPCKQHSEKGSFFGSWVCTQSLYHGSRCKLPVVPVVHTCFVRGMVFPWDISSKLMERRTTQLYVGASSSGHGWLGKPSELLEASDVKEETVDIGIPGLQSQFWLPAGAVGVSGAERCRGWDASCLPKTIVGGSREARSVAHLCFWHVFLSRHQATGQTWFLLFKTALAILTLYISTSLFKKVYIYTPGSAKTFCFHWTVCLRHLPNQYLWI